MTPPGYAARPSMSATVRPASAIARERGFDREVELVPAELAVRSRTARSPEMTARRSGAVRVTTRPAGRAGRTRARDPRTRPRPACRCARRRDRCRRCSSSGGRRAARRSDEADHVRVAGAVPRLVVHRERMHGGAPAHLGRRGLTAVATAGRSARADESGTRTPRIGGSGACRRRPTSRRTSSVRRGSAARGTRIRSFRIEPCSPSRRTGVIGGRSARRRECPARAAHTYGIAFTGRFAVYAGVNDPRSSSGTGNVRSTSNGASPRTRTRQPVGRRSHAGSTSVVQYQFAVNRTTSAPPLLPDDGRPLRGDRPGRELAGGEQRRRAARRRPRPMPVHSSTGRPAASASSAERGRELAEEVRGAARVERVDRPAEPHQLEQQVRRVALRQVGELVDLDRLDVALQRQQRERQRVGDEPGAASRRVDRRVARVRTRRATRARSSSPSRCPPPKSSPRVVTTFVPDSSNATTSSMSKRARHVEHAVGAERVDRRADRRSRGRRPAPRRTSAPASTPSFAGS